MRPRSTLVVLALAAVVSLAARPAAAQAPDRSADSAAVLQLLDRFLVGLRTKDTAAMSATMHPAVRFTLLRPAAPGADSVRVVALTGEQFMRAAANPAGPALDEPIRRPRVELDAHLATVWAEYQVRLEGKVSHCGYDAFQFVRTPAGWRILNVADTFRREGCGATW